MNMLRCEVAQRLVDRGIEPVFLPSHQFVGSRTVEEQLEYFYAQYARRVAPALRARRRRGEARRGVSCAKRERPSCNIMNGDETSELWRRYANTCSRRTCERERLPGAGKEPFAISARAHARRSVGQAASENPDAPEKRNRDCGPRGWSAAASPAEFAGMFKDDPLFDDWQKAIAEYRRQVDNDPDYL